MPYFPRGLDDEPKEQEHDAPAEAITDHEFVNYAPEDAPDAWMCMYVYKPENPLYADPSGGWLMGGPIECGGTSEQHNPKD